MASTGVAIDTHRCVQRLHKVVGLSEATAITLSNLLNEALHQSVQSISANSVTRVAFDRELSQYAIELSKIKNDLQQRQNQSQQQSKQTTAQLLREVRGVRQRTRESLGGIRSELRLEMNLERGKQRDAGLATAIKFQDLNTQVDAAVGDAYAALAKLRHDIFYSLTGFLFTSIAALFGFLRLAATG